MLTRIEVDGFKNLIAFSAEFGAFTCIAGPNAVGKSNLFDALELLSALARVPLAEAGSQVRARSGARETSRALFWSDGQGHAERIRIAVEMIAGGLVGDELGRGGREPNRLMRYEIELRYEGGLRLVNERLAVLDGAKTLRFPHHPSFVEAFVEDRSERVLFDLAAGVMPDGGPTVEPSTMRATLLSHYQTMEYADIFVAGETVRGWRRFALEPEALRAPYMLESTPPDKRDLLQLPLAWKRRSDPGFPHMDLSQLGTDPDTVSAEVVAKLAPIASLRSIWVDHDEERGRLTLHASSSSGEQLSARELSDGTLRYLALILLGMMPGTLRCIEEPENGIHPRRIAELAELLRDLATDFEQDITQELAELDRYDELPLRQLIINTHSRDLVRELHKHAAGDLLMASTVLTEGPRGREARALRLRPLRGTWRCGLDVRGVSLPLYSYIPPTALGASAAEDS